MCRRRNATAPTSAPAEATHVPTQNHRQWDAAFELHGEVGHKSGSTNGDPKAKRSQDEAGQQDGVRRPQGRDRCGFECERGADFRADVVAERDEQRGANPGSARAQAETGDAFGKHTGGERLGRRVQPCRRVGRRSCTHSMWRPTDSGSIGPFLQQVIRVPKLLEAGSWKPEADSHRRILMRIPLLTTPANSSGSNRAVKRGRRTSQGGRWFESSSPPG